MSIHRHTSFLLFEQGETNHKSNKANFKIMPGQKFNSTDKMKNRSKTI